MPVFDVLAKPLALRMIQWDGTNDTEVNEYIEQQNLHNGTTEVRYYDDGTAYIPSAYGDQPLVPGSLIHPYSFPHQADWPGITVYTPEEAEEQLYPYPDYPSVLEHGAR